MGSMPSFRSLMYAYVQAFLEQVGASISRISCHFMRPDHWDHLRTTNPIESVFATVRHRTVRMKGALSQDTARLMVFKLVMAASKTWRRLQGQNQLPKVIQGVKFQDGIEVAPEAKSAA